MDPNAADIPLTPSARAVPESIGILGAGRMGTALAAALRSAGVPVHGPAGRGEPLRACDAVLLCVPDAEIEAAAAAFAGTAPLTGHTSGATPLTALAAAGGDAFGLHPLMTVTGDGATLEGAGCAIAGTSPAALDLARRLAHAVGTTPFEIADEDRGAYHAAGSIASNFLIAVEAAAERVAASAGVERALLVPLVRATVENWAAHGPERALTGPVARGDEGTVARQREAIPEDLLPLFDALVDATRELAGARA